MICFTTRMYIIILISRPSTMLINIKFIKRISYIFIIVYFFNFIDFNTSSLTLKSNILIIFKSIIITISSNKSYFFKSFFKFIFSFFFTFIFKSFINTYCNNISIRIIKMIFFIILFIYRISFNTFSIRMTSKIFFIEFIICIISSHWIVSHFQIINSIKNCILETSTNSTKFSNQSFIINNFSNSSLSHFKSFNSSSIFY